MSKYKVGDEVVMVNSRNNPSVLKNGVTGVVLFSDDDIARIQFNIKKSEELHNGGELGEDGKCWTVVNDEIELLKLKSNSSFKTSNRYKLHKYILSTGFTKQDLSLALNKNQSYLTTETRASQFTNRGDMSDARYKSLRKQIKEAVQIKSSPVDISVVSAEINQTLAEVDPEDKKPKAFKVKDLKITIDGKELAPSLYSPFDSSPNESVSIEVTEKTSNNGAFILCLVFFVMLIIFGIGCLIYKAA